MKKQSLLSRIGEPKIEQFKWIYFEIGRNACLNAFGSHYGFDGDEMFIDLEGRLPQAQVEEAKRKDAERMEKV